MKTTKELREYWKDFSDKRINGYLGITGLGMRDFLDDIDTLESRVKAQAELLDAFKGAAEHAIELGHLGEGSTRGWFKRILFDLEKHSKDAGEKT